MEPHGKSAGLRSAEIWISVPFTTKLPLDTDTSPWNKPWMLSYFNK